MARDRLAKLPYDGGWFAVSPQVRQWQTHPGIGVFNINHYSNRVKAAGKSVGVVNTQKELESIAPGALPPLR